MPEITLQAEVGRPLGSRPARRLRHEGKIPGVVYGHGTDPVPVTVVGRDLRIALSGESGTNTLLSLVAGDQTFLTLARELQRHPVRGTVTHVDFQIVRRDEIISADVPIILIGEALEVHHGDGLVDQQLFTLPVRAKPADIPMVIEVDVTGPDHWGGPAGRRPAPARRASPPTSTTRRPSSPGSRPGCRRWRARGPRARRVAEGAEPSAEAATTATAGED